MMVKLNEQRIAAIAEAVSRDIPNIEACALFDIDEWTFYDWKRKGEADVMQGIEGSLHAKFYQAIKKAESKAIEEGLKYIREAGKLPNNWTARAWILERCYRKRFSVQGDALERIEKKMNDLEEKILKRSNKSVGAKANGSQEMDKSRDKSKA